MSRSDLNVAVTGANGFLGQRIVSSLLAEAVQVRAFVRTPAAATELRRCFGHEQLEVAHMDLAEPIDSHSLAGIDTLVHAAAHIPSNMAEAGDADCCMRINATGSLRLFSAAVDSGVDHVVHLSTGNAYRNIGRPAGEDDPLYPSRRAPYYLTSKVCGEVFAAHLSERGSCAVTILRPSAIYGPSMSQGGLVSTLVSRAVDRLPLLVADGGRYSADLVYVDDVAEAVSTCTIGRVTGTFNLGSGYATTTLQLAHELQSLLDLADDRIVIGEESSGSPGRGFASLNIERAVEVLGYCPRSLADGLAAMILSIERGDR